MLRILTIALALIGSAAPAAGADRRYPVTDFDRVVVEGPYQVRLTVGGPSAAVASGSPQALDQVAIDVQSGVLRVRRNPNGWSSDPRRAPAVPTILLTTRTLRAARLSGPGSLELSGARGLRIELVLDGAGRLAASGLAADNLTIVARGSGILEAAGRAGTARADVQGSATLRGSALAIENLTLFSATSGEVALTARRSASITANGLGTVEVAGSAACTVNGQTAGQVRCGRPAR